MRTSKTNHRVRGAGGHGAERTWNMPFTLHSISNYKPSLRALFETLKP